MARPLWAEQHPDDWWRAAQEAIQGVMKAANAPAESVSGIGLSGQMHGLVILDENNKVIRPALIWCDQRSQHQVDEINANSGPRECSGLHGESRIDRIHSAQVVMGSRRRTAKLSTRPSHAFAEGLYSIQADG